MVGGRHLITPVVVLLGHEFSRCCFCPLRLADLGHSVVGVEISEKAVRQFFEENNMTYSVDSVPTIPGAKVYKVSGLRSCEL